MMQSSPLAAFLSFNLISHHKGTKFPEANASGAFAGRLGEADKRTLPDVRKPCSLMGRIFPLSVKSRRFSRGGLGVSY